MYNRKNFGEDLKTLVLARDSVADIGRWAYLMYLDYDFNDDLLDSLVLGLCTLDLGPEFELSYEKLAAIADALIEGADIKPIVDRMHAQKVFFDMRAHFYTQQEYGNALKNKILSNQKK